MFKLEKAQYDKQNRISSFKMTGTNAFEKCQVNFFGQGWSCEGQASVDWSLTHCAGWPKDGDQNGGTEQDYPLNTVQTRCLAEQCDPVYNCPHGTLLDTMSRELIGPMETCFEWHTIIDTLQVNPLNSEMT